MTIFKCDTKTETDRVLKYKLTRSPETMKMSTLAGQRIDVKHYCIYDDDKIDKNGNEVKNTILTLMTVEGEIFGTNSESVRKEFLNILEIFEDDLTDGYIPIRIIQGTSKNNRTFYTATYAD